jgi:hypothetical protein
VDACDSMNVYHLSVGPPDAWRSPAKDAKKVSNAIKVRPPIQSAFYTSFIRLHYAETALRRGAQLEVDLFCDSCGTSLASRSWR